MMQYLIEIGSNYERYKNVAFARQRLAESFPDIVFEEERDTDPIGMYLRTEAMFTNQQARFASKQSPDEVRTLLKQIEREAGRTPEEKQQEIIRLDIDLLMCNDKVYKSSNLLDADETSK